jgi:hypothetical protein
VIDSWQNSRVPHTGVIVTAAWQVALLFAAGSPIFPIACTGDMRSPAMFW